MLFQCLLTHGSLVRVYRLRCGGISDFSGMGVKVTFITVLSIIISMDSISIVMLDLVVQETISYG